MPHISYDTKGNNALSEFIPRVSERFIENSGDTEKNRLMAQIAAIRDPDVRRVLKEGTTKFIRYLDHEFGQHSHLRRGLDGSTINSFQLWWGEVYHALEH